MTDVLAPVAGLVRPLAEVPDPVFAAEMVGAGVAIEPAGGVADAVSPVAGTVLKLHPHAFVVLTPEGTGVLVHLGIDTVRLDGAGFELLVQEKASVEAGQPVTRWDPSDVVARGLSPMVMLCVLDTRPGRRDQRPSRRHRVRGRAALRLAGRLVTAPPVAALLLDLDGTLVDSEPLHRARYRTWFAHRGWPYDDEVAAQFTGRRADDVFRTVDGPWSGEDPDALLAEIVALEPHRRLPEPVAGAAEAIAWARGGRHPARAGHVRQRPGGRSRCSSRSAASRPSTPASPATTSRRASPTRPATRWPAGGSAWMPVRRRPARTPPTACARPRAPGWARSSA